MAHWFHRNVLKATTNQKFELKVTNPTDATRKLCRLAIFIRYNKTHFALSTLN